MARIRTIKPEFWTSEQVVECSPTARLMFIGMWNFCDDYGNHPASYKTLKMEVFPGDEISLAEIEGLTKELIKNGLLIEYDGGNGRRYWHVTGWHHQKVDKPNSKHPPFNPSKVEKFDDHSSSAPRTFDDHSPPEGKGMEGNSKGKEKEVHTPTTVPNSNQEETTPTPAARVCRELRDSGIENLNPANPLLLELLKAGASVNEFVQAAKVAKEKGKGFNYLLAIVKGQRKEAKEAAKQVLHGDLPNKSPPGNSKKFQKFSGFDYINGGDGYGNKREPDEGRIIDGEVAVDVPKIQGKEAN